MTHSHMNIGHQPEVRFVFSICIRCPYAATLFQTMHRHYYCYWDSPSVFVILQIHFMEKRPIWHMISISYHILRSSQAKKWYLHSSRSLSNWMLLFMNMFIWNRKKMPIVWQILHAGQSDERLASNSSDYLSS